MKLSLDFSHCEASSEFVWAGTGRGDGPAEPQATGVLQNVQGCAEHGAGVCAVAGADGRLVVGNCTAAQATWSRKAL